MPHFRGLNVVKTRRQSAGLPEYLGQFARIFAMTLCVFVFHIRKADLAIVVTGILEIESAAREEDDIAVEILG